MTMAPAARSRPGTSPSAAAGGSSACRREPRVVVIPATSSRSLTRAGSPASGPTGSPAARGRSGSAGSAGAWSPRSAEPPPSPPRPRERLPRAQRDDRADPLVAGLDQGQGPLHQLPRGDLPVAQQLRQPTDHEPSASCRPALASSCAASASATRVSAATSIDRPSSQYRTPATGSPTNRDRSAPPMASATKPVNSPVLKNGTITTKPTR